MKTPFENYLFQIAALAMVLLFSAVIAMIFVDRLLQVNAVPKARRNLIKFLVRFSAFPLFFGSVRFIPFNSRDISALFSMFSGKIQNQIFDFLNPIFRFLYSDVALYVSISYFFYIVLVSFGASIVEKIPSKTLRFIVYFIFSFGSYPYYLLVCYLLDSKSSTKFKEGREVIKDPKIGSKTLKRLSEKQARGLLVHPDFYLPRSMENKHTLVIGSIGSGKTQLIFPILSQIIERKDKVIVYDRKGDYSEAFGNRTDVAILSPFYQGAFAWDIARDINTEMLHSEFASDLIPANSKEPIWEQAAQDLLTGCFSKLSSEKPDWDFDDLYQIARSKKEVITACQNHYLEALQSIGDPDDKQTSGVFMHLRNGTKKLKYLAQAWKNTPKKLSIKKWIEDDNHPIKTIILAGNPRYKSLDDFLSVQIFNLIYSEILSLNDDPIRRIWVVNDEQGNQPKSDKQINSLTEGRSKGLCVIAAIQGVGQMQEKLGMGQSKVWLNCFNTKFGGRLTDKEEPIYAAGAFGGTNRMERTSVSIQDDSSKGSRSKSLQHEQALVDMDFKMLPEANLKNGAYFWCTISDWPITLLKFPVKPIAKKFERKPMRWLTEGFKPELKIIHSK